MPNLLDPTNGILTQTDHIAVAVGRNDVDATVTEQQAQQAAQQREDDPPGKQD